MADPTVERPRAPGSDCGPSAAFLSLPSELHILILVWSDHQTQRALCQSASHFRRLQEIYGTGVQEDAVKKQYPEAAGILRRFTVDFEGTTWNTRPGLITEWHNRYQTSQNSDPAVFGKLHMFEWLFDQSKLVRQKFLSLLNTSPNPERSNLVAHIELPTLVICILCDVNSSLDDKTDWLRSLPAGFRHLLFSLLVSIAREWAANSPGPNNNRRWTLIGDGTMRWLGLEIQNLLLLCQNISELLSMLNYDGDPARFMMLPGLQMHVLSSPSRPMRRHFERLFPLAHKVNQALMFDV
ncbi:MAG: hypothetical protein M1837_006602 [Sclerophora amabilis]|nr:MAG: hypothetical protein M1837_006602 [Sclerophora amabilis]